MAMGESYWPSTSQLDEALMRGVFLIHFLGILETLWLLNSISEALLICGSGRMVWNYIPDAKLYRITAWRLSAYFVIFDIM